MDRSLAPDADETPGPGGIVLRGIGKTYAGRKVLDSVTFEVAPGEVVALLGPNGAGKSTLLRILATLVLADEGTARVAGCEVVREALEVRRRLGLVVGDERAWYWRLPAIENLAFFGALSGMRRDHALRRGRGLLNELGLGAATRQRVGTYSAGMRGRLALARALMHEPPVLILDEVTRSIDPVGAAEMRDLIRRTAVGRGVAVLMATHDMHDAASADRIVVLSEGRFRGSRNPGTAAEVEAFLREVAAA